MPSRWMRTVTCAGGFALAALPLWAGGVEAPATTTAGTAAKVPDSVVAEVLATMDRAADPCQDFYRYACGGWLDSTKIPADQTRWARSFSVIRERNRDLVRQILEEAGAHPAGDPDRVRIGNFYASCMDEAAIEKAGTQPLEPYLHEISGVHDAATLLAASGHLQRIGARSLFAARATPDFKDPGLDVSFLSQGGLGMPDRDYYVSTDPKKQELMEAYGRHVARMLALLGEPAEAAGHDAAAVVAFETELAKVSRPRAEMRDPDKLYHRMDGAGLGKLTPGLPWPAYFQAIGYPGMNDLNVATPEFFTTLDSLVAKTPPETLRAYLRWHLVDDAADALPAAFVDANFDFFGRQLSGQQEIEPRWKRCVEATEDAMGEAVGKLYVDAAFPGSSKQMAAEMIHDIEGAFDQGLPTLAWMDDTTRGRAREKMKAIANKIGYPDNWRDYSSIVVARGNYFADVVSANQFEFDRQAKKVGNPVDRSEWGMTPQTVNAYYNPLFNEIAFPAGIMQPPFFNRDFPTAMNYGGIGAVVGHELTHGFDDEGRKFDPTGKLAEWWEPEVAKRFEERAACVRDDYSSFEVEPGTHVNGQLTLGENLADLGGVKETYRAYKSWEGRHGAPPPAVPGLTNDQLLFVAFGQVWCSLVTPEEERRRITTDPHSPPRFRVIGALSNNAAFAEAFHCAEGTPMHPKNACEVW